MTTPRTHHRRRPHTYTVAVWVVALFFIAEAVMLVGIVWFRREKIQLDTVAPKPPPPKVAPAVNTAAPEVAVPNLPKPEIQGRLRIAPQTSKILRTVENLNQEAQAYRQRGEYSVAESALNQALSLDPEHTLTLANMAQLQEAMGDNEKALAHWQRILEQSGSNISVRQQARERVTLIRQRVQAEQEARQRELLSLRLKRQMVIGEVKPEPLNSGGTQMQVDFAIKRADRKLRVEGGRVRIQLFFYKLLANRAYEPVTAGINAFFVNPNADWSKADTELLRAQYTKGASEPAHGWLLRVYYNDDLQDERADPAELLNVFAE